MTLLIPDQRMPIFAIIEDIANEKIRLHALNVAGALFDTELGTPDEIVPNATYVKYIWQNERLGTITLHINELYTFEVKREKNNMDIYFRFNHYEVSTLPAGLLAQMIINLDSQSVGR